MAFYECIDKVKPFITIETVSGSICSFNDEYGGLPLKSCVVDLPVNQSGSGTPSPTNIRDFIGYNKLTFGNIGDSDIKNYLTGVINGTYGFVDLGTLNWAYASFQSTNHYFHANKPDDCKDKNDDVGLTNCCNSKKYVIASSTSIMNNSVDKAISVGGWGNNTNWIYIADTDYTDAATFKAAMSGVYLIYELETPTASSYTKEQFDALCNSFDVSGISATFNFGQTVYGGVLDVLTGELVLSHELKTVDENSGVAMSATEGIFYLEDFFEIDNDNESVYCNCYIKGINRRNTAQVANNEDYSFCCQTQTLPNRLMIKDTRFTTIEDYNTWLKSNPVEIAVKLATPITIHLGGVNLLTQEGQNNILADCGDLTVEYIKIN